MPSTDLPFLDWEMLEPGAEFGPFTLVVTAEMVADYAHVVGARPADANVVPPGFAGVLGRRAYLERHRMPPGGVLLKQRIRWRAPAVIGEPIEARATVAERREADGRRRVTMHTVGTQRGEPVVDVEMALGWPT